MEKKIIINIGRQFGGGGLAVASELGKKLGIPVYDRELITKAAQDSGFSAELFEHSDEKRRIFSLASIFSSLYSSPTENYMSDNGLFEILDNQEDCRTGIGSNRRQMLGLCS